MQKRNEKPWHEKDDFWQTWAPVIFTNERMQLAKQEVDQILLLLQLQPGSSICDLCCGVGRHSLELARRGFQVTGVDRTPRYLQQAKRKASAERLDIQFVEHDMRRFCRPDSFDAVINMFTSFGYFEDLADDRAVLENVHKSLKSNGKLLIDLMGKEVLARIFLERDWRQEGDATVLWERKASSDWSSIECLWTLLRDGKRHEYRFAHRVYSAVELRTLLNDCGFGRVDVYGGLDKSRYDHKAERLVLLAHK
jgi:SAM-dependent methyltransferase